MENRVYDMEKGQFAFLYKLPPKLILFLSTIVWLAAGLLIGAAAKSLLGLPVNIEGMAAFISLVMRKRDLFNKKKVSFQESTG